MTIKILYFAAVRDAVGVAEEQLVLPGEVTTIAALRHWLASRGGVWQVLEQMASLRCARNQRMAAFSDCVAAGDEIAFFPPVTGG